MGEVFLQYSFMNAFKRNDHNLDQNAEKALNGIIFWKNQSSDDFGR